MAVINYRLAESIKSIFYPHSTMLQTIDIDRGSNSFDKNRAFRRFVYCNMVGREFEVPIILRHYVEERIRRLYRSYTLPNRELVMPLLNQEYYTTKRTADSILNNLFSFKAWFGLQSIITNKEVKYYGNVGCILDGNYKPLFYPTLLGHFVLTEEGEITGFEYTECRIHVHNSVLTSESDLICKAIMKKVLPYMMSDEVRILYLNDRATVSNNLTKKIIIEDISDFIKSPVSMSDNYTDEDVNNFLAENVDDVLNQLKV
jgi:hypothetical protein